MLYEESLTEMGKQLKEALAILMVGDGVIGLIAPRRHSLLWKFGPKSYRRVIADFAERPILVRLLSVASVGAGLWLALRQYEER
jgi:hypothetical protein